ncbi:MAG: hypothetical protein HY917_03215 [Candidatus Diapherotrites archaeon]|nr:hypothetical protein [Candidatus Diapherotrites archaeon]
MSLEKAALQFAQKKISFKELVRLIGRGPARKVAFLIEVSRKSLQKGLN